MRLAWSCWLLEGLSIIQVPSLSPVLTVLAKIAIGTVTGVAVGGPLEVPA